jgi:hypothetical protein
MRDPKRIKRIVKLLERLWLQYPDLRFGQLLFNYCFGDNDIFYREDNITEKVLKHYVVSAK